MIPRKSTRIRREEIVQAALAVIGERGTSALTIAAIAERAGMSEANIYRHFGGKRDILMALIDFIEQRVMGRAAAVAAGSGSPLSKLETIFNSHIALIAELPGMPRFIFSEEVHLADRELADRMAQRMANYAMILTGLIAAGLEEGEIRPQLAPRETALTLLGMISFTALRWSMSGCAFDLKAEARSLWRNFGVLIGR